MNKLYMGIDTGCTLTKGVLIDEFDNLVASSSFSTLSNPIDATRNVILRLKEQINLNDSVVLSVGVTGYAKKLVGVLLDTNVIENEVEAITSSVLKLYSNASCILEIGVHDFKVIYIKNGVLVDYFISKNNFLFCLENDSSFLDDLIKKLDTDVILVGFGSKNKLIISRLCNKINNLIIFPNESLFMGAMGVAIKARENKNIKIFDFSTISKNVSTDMLICQKCYHNCKMVVVYKDNVIVDCWGNKCISLDL